MCIHMIEYDFAIALKHVQKAGGFYKLIERITDYTLKAQEPLKERIGEIMGGKVFELETDKILKKGIEQGLQALITQCTAPF